MANKVITWAFYILFAFTPLFFTSINSELFEFNKMLLVYILTVIITGTWLIKMVVEKKLLIKRTPLDIPLILFLASQILSTIFSIDPHTSIWGYYSRQNGGLLSIISYILLYYAIVSLFDFSQVLKFLKAAILGGLVVSLWAIPEHFGFDPSCAIIANQWNATCWVQDVQARVFATLGQPNWLAAYLEMLIFPAIYFFLLSESLKSKIFYLISIVLFYLAFTFTYSRGAMIGMVVALVVFAIALLLKLGFMKSKKTEKSTVLKPFLIVVGAIIIINILFGSALTGNFKLLKQGASPARPGITNGTNSVGTQLENGGTESGQIRLIVWKGALEIFKHYPIFGSGVETFAYSYYNFRPIAHNLTSEWDYLYNKAHNEYLNYLATTGIVGYLSYMLIIVTFIAWAVCKIFNLKFLIFNSGKRITNNPLLISAILASYISYLIQDFFGFSVVIVALFFFVFPAIAIVAVEELSYLKLPKFLNNISANTLYKRQFYRVGIQIVIVVIMALSLFSIGKYWVADINYSIGQNETDIAALEKAVSLHGNEPLYHSELGYTAAAAASSVAEKDATYSADLKDLAVLETEYVLTKYPRNVSLWRTAIRTYYQLSILDPSYEQKTVDLFDQTIKLAPTDPKLYYNKGLLLQIMNKDDDAISSLEKAVALKPNYVEAFYSLAEEYQKNNQYAKSKNDYEAILRLLPGEQKAAEKIKELEASISASKSTTGN